MCFLSLALSLCVYKTFPLCGEMFVYGKGGGLIVTRHRAICPCTILAELFTLFAHQALVTTVTAIQALGVGMFYDTNMGTDFPPVGRRCG